MGFRIDPGQLRHTVTIKAEAVTENPDGTWTNVAVGSDNWRAKIEWMRGEEFQDANKQTRIATRKMTMRYYAGLTAGHQLVFDGRTFDILSVEDFEERREWHILKVAEVV